MVTGLELKRDVIVVGNHTAMAAGAIQAPGTIAALWGRDPAQEWGERANLVYISIATYCASISIAWLCIATFDNNISCAL